MNLFDVLQRGENLINSIKQYAIMVIGQSRSGKSCFCNHIRNKAMIGRADETDPTQVYYVPQNEDDDSFAVMGHSFASVTLIPNVFQVNDQQTLIDLAGFGENRDEVGVMAVSYFLHVSFEKLRKVKFVMVFSETEFCGMKIDGVTDTLNNFIDLFRFGLMDVQMIKDLIKSVSIVVTRANKSMDALKNRLNIILTRLKEQKQLDRVRNKDIIIQILTQIKEYSKIQIFKQAQVNNVLRTSTYLDNLDRMGWEYFDLERTKKSFQKGKQLIVIPFEKDINNLSKNKQEAFISSIVRRNGKIAQGFAEIIKTFFETIKSNWSESFLHRTEYTETILLEKLVDSSKMFQKIDTYLSQNFDIYTGKDLIDRSQLKKQNFKSSFIEVLKSSLNIFQIQTEMNVNLGNLLYEGSLENVLRELQVVFPRLAYCMMPFCRCQSHQQKIDKVVFVLRRAIREYSMFSQIKIEENCQKFHLELPDLFNQKISNKNYHIEDIVNQIDASLLALIFKNIQDLSSYEFIVDTYVEVKKIGEGNVEVGIKVNEEQLDFKYCRIKVDIWTAKLDIHLKGQFLLPAIRDLTQLLKYLFKIDGLMTTLNLSEEKLTRQRKMNHLKKLKYIKLISSILLKLNRQEHPFSHSSALNLSQLSNSPYETEQIYKKLLKETNNQRKQDLLNRYAIFLVKWGRIQDAIKVLFQIMSFHQDRDDSQKMKDTLGIIQTLQTENAEIKEKYRNFLMSVGEPFSQTMNLAVSNMIEQISIQFDADPIIINRGGIAINFQPFIHDRNDLVD